jgi:hypothetical protein
MGGSFVSCLQHNVDKSEVPVSGCGQEIVRGSSGLFDLALLIGWAPFYGRNAAILRRG